MVSMGWLIRRRLARGKIRVYLTLAMKSLILVLQGKSEGGIHGRKTGI